MLAVLLSPASVAPEVQLAMSQGLHLFALLYVCGYLSWMVWRWLRKVCCRA